MTNEIKKKIQDRIFDYLFDYQDIDIWVKVKVRNPHMNSVDQTIWNQVISPIHTQTIQDLRDV